MENCPPLFLGILLFVLLQLPVKFLFLYLSSNPPALIHHLFCFDRLDRGYSPCVLQHPVFHEADLQIE